MCALFHCHASHSVDAPRVQPKLSLANPVPRAVPKPTPEPALRAVRDPCGPEPEPPVPEQGPLALWVNQAGLSDPEQYWQAIPFWAKPCRPPSADGADRHRGCGSHGPVTCWQRPCPFLSDLAEDTDAPREIEDVAFSDERFVKGCGQRMPAGTLSGLAALLFGKNGEWMPHVTGSKIDQTARKLDRYASVAFPAWWRAHRDTPCPETINQLDHYIGARDSLDAWGHPIKLSLCGSSMPDGQGDENGLRGFMLVSAGEDGQFDTLDDLAIARQPVELEPRAE